MRQSEWLPWMNKTERLNRNATIAIGDMVKDVLGKSGKVVDIRWPLAFGDDGTISVALTGGGEEHYHISNWKRILRRM